MGRGASFRRICREATVAKRPKQWRDNPFSIRKLLPRGTAFGPATLSLWRSCKACAEGVEGIR
jgi:hypothetical protein